MELIHSKQDTAKLLHIVYRKEDLVNQQQRGVNISPDAMALQLRAISAKKGEVFPDHKHPPQHRTTDRTQESLVIIQGSAKATLYDTDDTALLSTVLKAGDSIITFEGGHRYEILEDKTLIYEHKNGPYNGLEKDKVMIGGPDA